MTTNVHGQGRDVSSGRGLENVPVSNREHVVQPAQFSTNSISRMTNKKK